ncbi:MAG TPA: hypothetical protein PKO15_17375 [Fibrobacteria bacterium]|nr:hypothetical protein [Fibrobacteria bacterium]
MTIVKSSETTMAFFDSANGTAVHRKYESSDGGAYMPVWYAYDAQGRFSKLIQDIHTMRDTTIVNAAKSLHYVATDSTWDTTVFSWHGNACADEEQHRYNSTLTTINDVPKEEGEYDTVIKRNVWTLDADGHCATGVFQYSRAGVWSTNSTTKIFWNGSVPISAIELGRAGDTLSKRMLEVDEANHRLVGYQDSVKGKRGWYRSNVTTAVYDTKGILYMVGTDYDTIGRVVQRSVASHNRSDLDKIVPEAGILRAVSAEIRPLVQLRRGILHVSNPSGVPVVVRLVRLDGSSLGEIGAPAGVSMLPMDLPKAHGLCLWSIRGGAGPAAGTLLLP